MSISSVSRRAFNAMAVSALALAGAPAMANDFPNKPIKWIVGYPAGGGSDFIARTVAGGMSEVLGQSIVVENRTGASGLIGAQALIAAEPDGYTIMSADNGVLVYNSGLYAKLPYDPQKDFSSIGLMVRFPILLVGGPSNTFTSVKELMETLRQKPGEINYATGGLASPQSIAMEMLKDKSQVDATAIHYRGGAPAITDLVGGHVPLMTLDVATATPLLKAEKIKPVASFSKGGLPSMPQVESLVDLGYTDVEAFAWQGLVAPANTPPAVVEKLSDALSQVMQDPAIRGKLEEFGVEIITSSPAKMDAYLESESDYWVDLLRRRNITAEAS